MIQKTKLAVNMTTEGEVVCQRCLKAQPEGVTLTFVKNADKARRGRNCCPGCLLQYRVRNAGLNNPQADSGNGGMHFIFTTHIMKILTALAVGRSIWQSG